MQLLVAVIGGATAGAEVASLLAERGAEVVVFEQNPRPYGKIEDGLPRWHKALRQKEYETIRGKLSQPRVHFVPNTRVGRDFSFEELAREWGFSALVLSCGSWRDRPLAIEGAERFVGKGLIYQNPFIIWFNHAGEAKYAGPRFEPQDGALVVGGGLASIDVVKVLMLETTRAALKARGIDAPMIELEVKGIPKILEAHGLRWEDLGLQGCTLFYRRRVEDMPLVEIPEDATLERRAKVEGARRKLLEKAMEKYRFRMEELAAPDALVIEGDRLAGLRFRRMRMEAGKLVPSDETFERRGPYVISSIGSIPEPIAGIETKGELYRFSDWELGRLDAYPNVFSAGNVVTGKGNIVASRKHATHVGQKMAEAFLGLSENGHAGEEALLEGAAQAARESAEALAGEIQRCEPVAPDVRKKIFERVQTRQHAVGYDGNLATWLARVTPPDLE